MFQKRGEYKPKPFLQTKFCKHPFGTNQYLNGIELRISGLQFTCRLVNLEKKTSDMRVD